MAQRPPTLLTAGGNDLGWVEVLYAHRQRRTQIYWPSRDGTPTWLGLTPSGVPIERLVTVLFAKDSDDVLVVSLENASPLRGSDLSRTAWSRVIEVARTQRTRYLEQGRGPRPDINRLLGEIGNPEHPGRRGYGDDHYRLIGEWADELRDDNQVPQREIARQLDKPEKTVKNWIDEARRRGFARPGRSGRPAIRKDVR